VAADKHEDDVDGDPEVSILKLLSSSLTLCQNKLERLSNERIITKV
jgi:hypothetical protein